jgi:hypothetical protein
MIGQIIDALQTRIRPFNNKICECLRLNRPPGDEFDIILANFHDPLCDSPHCFFTLEYSSEWAVGYNPNYVRQKVMLQLLSRHEYRVEQFLHLWIPHLSVLYDFADKIHGLLLDLRYRFWLFNGNNCADHSFGSRHVQ